MLLSFPNFYSVLNESNQISIIKKISPHRPIAGLMRGGVLRSTPYKVTTNVLMALRGV